jgi:putative ABC transport system permease protein
MGTFAQDARFAVKLLVKQKSFTAAALLTLALCIGANTAIFSVLNSVLLRPLPFRHGDRLVHIYNSYPRAGVERGGAAVPDYYDRREEVAALEAVAMTQSRGMTLGGDGRPERVTGMAVTPSFFDVLGISAAEGRTFLEEEGEPGANHQALLSWALWHEQYAGSGDAIGATIRINDVTHTIVGVMPRRFVFEDPDVRVWVPLAFTEEQRSDNARHSNNWAMIARLREGATIAQAQAQVDALNARTDERLPQFRAILEPVGFRTWVVDYRRDLTRDVRGTLWLLQAGVLLVLLIGCVNIANLVLVRSTSRHRELATRAALGAPRTRLARQLVTESLVLAGAGATLGILAGWGGMKAFTALLAAEVPRGAEIALDGTTLLAAIAVAAVAGLLFGAIPVARLIGADLSGVFREEGRSGTAGAATNRWRSGLVVAQVSLAFALLVGAGLMLASFSRTLDVDTGFTSDNLLTASVSLPMTRYADAAVRQQFADRLTERVRALPGVRAAAVTSSVPFGGSFSANAVTPEGRVPRPDESPVAPTDSRVSDGYFETMDIELVAGRTFNASDVEGALPVAIIDEWLAEYFWPGADPIGRRIARGVPEAADDRLEYRTIVGVVGNVRARTLTRENGLGHFYTPAAQEPPGQYFVIMRTAVNPSMMTNTLRAALAEIDPELPLYDVRTMHERIAQSVVTERVRMLLLVAFGSLALFLAVVGLYGVLAWTVAQRSAEIGIRMALGSSAAAVFRMVLGHGARLLAIGLLLGLAASLALGRVVHSMLYGVRPGDPLVLGAVLVLLAVTALAACALPARRAMKVDPLAAMRDGG